jgi:hypothetical protein
MELGPYLAESIPGMGALGAIVAGTNATARNIQRLRDGAVSESEAILDIGEEALKNGVATALTFAVVGAIGGEVLASVAATLVVGSSLKFLWDRGSDYVEAAVKDLEAAEPLGKKS